MTDGQRTALALASRLLAYPDRALYEKLPELGEVAAILAGERPTMRFGEAALAFIAHLSKTGPAKCGSHYVELFDLTAAASLYMTWHRYGNDRSQGRAMAALNGLYRAAGLEPEQGEMPDYLPCMLEFLAMAPDWACETLLDGFGCELARLVKTLRDFGSGYGNLLQLALMPLREEFPACFGPRQTPDPTRRPMANPASEPAGPLLPIAKDTD